MDKYIIYTMRIPEINEAAQKELERKGGYVWGGTKEPMNFRYPYALYIAIEGNVVWQGVVEEEYKEINFRQLCELSPVYDENKSIADSIFTLIKNSSLELEYPKTVRSAHHLTDWAKEINWCKVWEHLKEKLGV